MAGPGANPDANFRCELHMHSHYSDGSFSPEYLLRRAAEKELATVALTDHDNARGAREAVPIAAALGLDFIPAIEFTGRWDECVRPGWGGDVDVLGYFIDLDDAGLQAMERAALDDIHARIEACCARLTAAGYAVTMDEVFAQNPRYGGARQVRQVLAQKGYAGHERAFATHWQRTRFSRFTIDRLIEVIHEAGGVAIMAHPTDIGCGAGWLQEAPMARLVELGIDGIEVYHRAMNEEARRHFGALAERFGLLVSGGSDEHGWSAELPFLGQEPVTRAMVEALRARHIARGTDRREKERER